MTTTKTTKTTKAVTPETTKANEQATGAESPATNTESNSTSGDGAADPASKSQLTVFGIGINSETNGEAAEVLCQIGFPLDVVISNRMPRRITLPELKGLSLEHVAGLQELRERQVRIRNEGVLHRFITDVQALCELSGYTEGVLVTVAI